MIIFSKCSIASCFWEKGGDKGRSHTESPNCCSVQGWRMATRHQLRVPDVMHASRALPRWFRLFWNAVDITDQRIRKSFQCSLADTVNLTVSILPVLFCDCLAGVFVQSILFSLICCGTRFLLPAPTGCHVLYIHHDMLFTASSFPLRRTNPCSWAQEPGPSDLGLTLMSTSGCCNMSESSAPWTQSTTSMLREMAGIFSPGHCPHSSSHTYQWETQLNS